MARWLVPFTSLLTGGLIGVFAAGPLLHAPADASASTAAVSPGPPPVNANPPAVSKELPSYRDIVKKVLPAVVSIEMHAQSVDHKKASKHERKFQVPDDPRIPEDVRKQFEGMVPFDFGDENPDEPQNGFGSGFLIDPKGMVLTNNHVVDGATQVEITLADGRKFVSRDIKKDPKTDLAVVRIDAKAPVPYLELGDSDAMEIGDRVLAVGAPFGLTGSVTAGIISGKGRSLHMNLYEDFLQTDAAINPGNSGGPLINLDGKVIGINAAIKTRTGGFQGVGLAVPSNMAKNVAEQLIKNGVVHRAYLGVQIKDLVDRDLAARLGVQERGGVVVTQVFADSPAGKAGLQAGDVIVKLNGKAIKDTQELQNEVAVLPLHQAVELIVVREGKTQALQVTVEERPQDYATAQVPAPRAPEEKVNSLKVEKVGLELADLTPRSAEALGYEKGTKGVVITRVKEDSAAATAGLTRGMLIARVDRQEVTSAADAKKKLEAATLNEGVLLQVQSPAGGTNYVLLRAAAEAGTK